MEQPDIRDFETEHEPTDYTDHSIKLSPDGKTAIVGYLVHDDDPQNPREDYEPLGTLVVHDDDYSGIAEKHNYCTEYDKFIVELASEVDPTAAGKIEYWNDENNPFLQTFYDAKEIDWDAIEAIQNKMRDKIVEEALHETVIIPVSITSQSYTTISWQECGTCNLESDADAHIFITPEKIIHEYGVNTEETREKARQYMMGELENLKTYLEGDVYGMIIERHELTENEEWELVEDLESTWGIYGREHAEKELEDEVNSYWEETTEPEPAPAEYADAA